MTETRRTIGKGQVGPERLNDSVLRGRYCFESFMQEPLVWVKGSTTEPAGTSLTEQAFNTGRNTFEYTFAGDSTDAFFPTLASEGGYNWGAFTTVAGSGVEVNFGGLKDGHPRNYQPSSEDSFARVLLILDDASGADIFFGFRKVAAYAATLTEYSDVAGIRILGDSSSTTGAFTVITNLNNAGSTDYTATALSVTPLEDATAIELEVRSVAGKAQFYVNGVEYRPTTYTFDSGDIVAPVARFLQATDVAAQIKTLAFECGLLDSRQEGSLLSLAGATT
jgi:hypothetical protein